MQDIFKNQMVTMPVKIWVNVEVGERTFDAKGNIDGRRYKITFEDDVSSNSEASVSWDCDGSEHPATLYYYGPEKFKKAVSILAEREFGVCPE